MGEVLGLLVIAVLTLAAVATLAQIARTARHRRELEKQNRPARLQMELGALDDYIRDLDQAATDDDLTRLERERNSKGWDGSSSR